MSINQISNTQTSVNLSSDNQNLAFNAEINKAGYGLKDNDLAALYNVGKPEVYDPDSVENSKTAVAPLVGGAVKFFSGLVANKVSTGLLVSGGVVTLKNMNDDLQIADVKIGLADWAKSLLLGGGVVDEDSDEFHAGTALGKHIVNKNVGVKVILDPDEDAVSVAAGILNGIKKAEEAQESNQTNFDVMTPVSYNRQSSNIVFPAIEQTNLNTGFLAENHNNINIKPPKMVEQNNGTGFKSLPVNIGEISGVEIADSLNDAQIYLNESSNDNNENELTEQEIKDAHDAVEFASKQMGLEKIPEHATVSIDDDGNIIIELGLTDEEIANIKPSLLARFLNWIF